MITKTSIDSPIFIVEVVPPNDKGGWVAITLAPGKKTRGVFNKWDRDLDADLDKLKELGVTTLMPLIEDDEMAWLKIPNLVEASKARGLNVIRFPFHDGGIPKDMDATVRLIEDIIDLSNKGERLCIHCNGGLGRAGMIAACVRLALGLEANPEHAIAMVRKLRSHRAIETIAQERFVGRFHIAWHGKQS